MPSSSDEDEEKEKNVLEEENLAQIAIIENNNEDERDFDVDEQIRREKEDPQFIGPIPPVPGRSEEEEQFEYLARLAEFEANKKVFSL